MQDQKSTDEGSKRTISVRRPSDAERAFAIFDKDNDGSITKNEIKEALQESDVNFTDSQLEKFMKELDHDGDGSVDCKEFCKVMSDIIQNTTQLEENIRNAFQMIDSDGSGKINQSELRDAVLDLGESISKEEVDEIIGTIDDNGDKEIDFDEFVRLMYHFNIVPEK